jgi:multidrug transporter EmrE-like cation transporter
MSPLALSLLLVAAVLHAGWNLLTKRAGDRQATLWWGLVVAGLLLTPTLGPAWPPRWEALALALASSIFELVYFLALMAAYGVGDFSLVYPVARGSAPLLIALWAALWLGERPSAAGWSGIGLVVGGLVLASAPGRAAPTQPERHRPGVALALALATGLCISGYSIINKKGLEYLPAPAFTCLFHLGTAALLAPILLRTRGAKLAARVEADAAGERHARRSQHAGAPGAGDRESRLRRRGARGQRDPRCAGRLALAGRAARPPSDPGGRHHVRRAGADRHAGLTAGPRAKDEASPPQSFRDL